MAFGLTTKKSNKRRSRRAALGGGGVVYPPHLERVMSRLGGQLGQMQATTRDEIAALRQAVSQHHEHMKLMQSRGQDLMARLQMAEHREDEKREVTTDLEQWLDELRFSNMAFDKPHIERSAAVQADRLADEQTIAELDQMLGLELGDLELSEADLAAMELTTDDELASAAQELGEQESEAAASAGDDLGAAGDGMGDAGSAGAGDAGAGGEGGSGGGGGDAD